MKCKFCGSDLVYYELEKPSGSDKWLKRFICTSCKRDWMEHLTVEEILNWQQ